MIAKVINTIFALTNLIIVVMNIGPGVLAILSGGIGFMAILLVGLGSGVFLTVVAMINPQRLSNAPVHVLTLAFASALITGSRCLYISIDFLRNGIFHVGLLMLFFACSLAWGLWFVTQLIRINRARALRRHSTSR